MSNLSVTGATMTPVNGWRDPAVPRVTVQTLPIDDEMRVLVMHRSSNVRSAKNVWSFPSGLHEVGQTIYHGIEREMQEEYGLRVYRSAVLGAYENIAGDPGDDPQYHWTIVLMGSIVDPVTRAINREPDKHDEMKHVHVTELGKMEFWRQHQFHPSFQRYAVCRRVELVQALIGLVADWKMGRHTISAGSLGYD